MLTNFLFLGRQAGALYTPRGVKTLLNPLHSYPGLKMADLDTDKRLNSARLQSGAAV